VPTVSPDALTCCCGERLKALARLALSRDSSLSFSPLVVFLVLRDLEECCANICDGAASKNSALRKRAMNCALRERKRYLELVVNVDSFFILCMKGNLR
jgi:hypothetical protein